MGFFDDQAVAPQRPEPPQVPEWLRPGTHQVGVPLPEQAVLFNNGAIAVVVCGLVAYTTGLQFQIQVRWNGAVERDEVGEFWSPHDGIRRGVVLADGTALHVYEPSGPGWPPAAPSQRYTLCSLDGGGDDGRVQVTSWIHPLPPDGPITFIAQWQRAGIPEASATLEFAHLGTVALRSIELWPSAS